MALSDSLKYFAWFVVVIALAFTTYFSFLRFSEAVWISNFVLVLNAGVIFLLWFLAFTAKGRFVEENVKMIVFVPLITLYTTDMYIALQYGQEALSTFIVFMSSSAAMIAASYQFSRYEKKLKRKEKEAEAEL